MQVYERTFGSFSRSVQVPSGLTENDVKCKLEHGVLQIELPKKTESQSCFHLPKIFSATLISFHSATPERAVDSHRNQDKSKKLTEPS